MNIRLLFSLALASYLSAAEDAYDCLLVSPPELIEPWKAYAMDRTAAGVKTKVISLATIAKRTEGKDLQEKIRLACREAIEKHAVKWIILGGDSTPDGGLIPDRDTVHDNMWGQDQDIPTDIYYLSPTSWDADDDGRYGEFTEDRKAITYPDGSVGIGRIPIRTQADIEAYRQKVSAYLTSLSEGQAPKNLTMTCTVPGAYAKVYRSGSELIPARWDHEVKFLFNDFTSWDEEEKGDFDLIPKNIIAKMNEGDINKWHLHGHGLTHCWNLEHHQDFSFDQVSQLKNLKNLPVITTVSCFTGHFDATQDPCISEAMLRAPEGGAIAIVAPSREGKPHFHKPEEDFPLMVREGKLDGTTQTMTQFWISSLGDKHSTGQALAQAKATMAQDAQQSATYHQGLCEINLLGDPSLPVK